MQRPPTIETERLFLVALVPEDIEALIAGDLERVSLLTGFTFLLEDPKLGADLSWHLRALRADSNQRSWRIRVIVEQWSNTVVGSINLKGPPSAYGDVEIGFSVPSGVLKLTNEVTLGEFWCVSATVNSWDCRASRESRQLLNRCTG
jgi:RimJ/RimL family protein N-acetyltransferase